MKLLEMQEYASERMVWENRISDYCETNSGMCSGYSSIDIRGLAEAIVNAIYDAVEADREERN